MKVCPYCRGDNADDAVYCESCGSRIPLLSSADTGSVLPSAAPAISLIEELAISPLYMAILIVTVLELPLSCWEAVSFVGAWAIVTLPISLILPVRSLVFLFRIRFYSRKHTLVQHYAPFTFFYILYVLALVGAGLSVLLNLVIAGNATAKYIQGSAEINGGIADAFASSPSSLAQGWLSFLLAVFLFLYTLFALLFFRSLHSTVKYQRPSLQGAKPFFIVCFVNAGIYAIGLLTQVYLLFSAPAMFSTILLSLMQYGVYTVSAFLTAHLVRQYYLRGSTLYPADKNIISR